MNYYVPRTSISSVTLCFLLGSLMTMDVLLTYHILLDGGVEVNGFALFLLNEYGFAGLIAEKAFFLGLLVSALLLQLWIYGRPNRWFVIPTQLAVFVYALLVIYEVCLVNRPAADSLIDYLYSLL